LFPLFPLFWLGVCVFCFASFVAVVFVTPWKFNIAPENGWLEDEFPFGIP